MPPGRSLWLCAALLAPANLAVAQDPGPVYEAPYVPSPISTVDEMLRLASLGPGDVVYDLGAGDGRVVITAASKFGARGVGVEIDAALVAMARSNAARAGVADRVRFLQQDMFKTDLREATVVALYLSPNFNLRLRPALLALKPGTRVVSQTSGMGDWRADRSTAVRKDVLLWIVPAQVAGNYRLPQGELSLQQEFQMLSGTLRTGGKTLALEGRVRGEEVSFRAGGRQYRGRMNGKTLELR